MSAFMVQDRVINRVVVWLNSRDHEWNRDRILEVAQLDSNDDEWQEKLGASMFQLNMDGVNSRYGEGQAAEFRSLDYRFAYEMSNDIQVLKSLQCWLYQCSEGDVPEMPLYKAFAQLAGEIAIGIVGRMDAYDRAEW